WQAVFGVLLIPMLLILAYYAYAAKDAPGDRKPISLKAYGTLLRDPDSRWFMFFYFITFGGFVGLANALPLYFTVQYHVSGVAAGLLVSLIVAFGSGFRPVGGLIADRIGGIRSLSVLFGIVVASYLVIAFMPEGPAAPTASAASSWRRRSAPPRPPPAASVPASCFSARWHCLALSDLPWSRSGGARHGAPSPGRASDPRALWARKVSDVTIGSQRDLQV